MDPGPHFAPRPNPAGVWHRLRDHLESPGCSTRALPSFAAWADEADLAARLHDIAKYGDLFQGRVRRAQSGIDHWSLRAWLPLRDHKAVAATLA